MSDALTDSLETRASLLWRLRDPENARDWREFHRRYGGLIRAVVKRSGLSDAAADDVLQETLISVARRMPDFCYDPALGTFKGWLLTITRRRLADYWRRFYREPDAAGVPVPEGQGPDENSGFEAVWEEEWRRHTLGRALDRLGAALDPRQRQVFQLAVVEAWPAAEVARATGLPAAAVYLMKHRVGRLVRMEVELLEREEREAERFRFQGSVKGSRPLRGSEALESRNREDLKSNCVNSASLNAQTLES